jgi:hypothetical protein
VQLRVVTEEMERRQNRVGPDSIRFDDGDVEFLHVDFFFLVLRRPGDAFLTRPVFSRASSSLAPPLCRRRGKKQAKKVGDPTRYVGVGSALLRRGRPGKRDRRHKNACATVIYEPLPTNR